MNAPTTQVLLTANNLKTPLTQQIAYNIAAGRAFGPFVKISLTLHQLAEEVTPLNTLAQNLTECSLPLLQKAETFKKGSNPFITADYIVVCIGDGERVIEIVNLANQLGNLIKKSVNSHSKVVVVGSGNVCLLASLLREISIKNGVESAVKNILYSTAVTAHVQNCLTACVAKHLDMLPRHVKHAVVWGTELPDLSYEQMADQIDENWKNFTVKTKLCFKIFREADLAHSLCKHLFYLSSPRDCTHIDDWIMMGVPSDGSYGIPCGLVFGLAMCLGKEGELTQLSDLSPDEFMAEKIMYIAKEEIEKVDLAHKYICQL